MMRMSLAWRTSSLIDALRNDTTLAVYDESLND